jgi:hypothetical protein
MFDGLFDGSETDELGELLQPARITNAVEKAVPICLQ